MAQVASTNCLSEMKAAFQNADLAHLLKSGSTHFLQFTRTSLHEEQAGGNPVTEKRTAIVGSGVAHFLNKDEEIYSDLEEAFAYYPQRATIYRTKSVLSESAIIPEINGDTWAEGRVVLCDFVKATDTTSFKRAIFRTYPDSKSLVEDLEIVFSPFNGSLSSVKIRFKKGAGWISVRYDFSRFDSDFQPETPLGKVAGLLLDGNGNPKDRFTGNKVLDYRK